MLSITLDILHAYGKYPAPGQIKFESYRLLDGVRTTDAKFDMDLKNRRLLHTRAYVRPSLINDVKTMEISMPSSPVIMTNAVSREVSGRKYYMKRMVPDVTPVTDYVRSEAASFSRDYADTKNALSNMVTNNEFYLNDISNKLQRYSKIARCVLNIKTIIWSLRL